jgi:exodeoxyribonuclease VII small subunit
MTTTPEQNTPAEDLSFEDALLELEGIVGDLERGETTLEASIANFERGMALARRCEDRLGEAEKKVGVLLKEGSQIIEVDMSTGERLAVHDDPGDEILPADSAQEPAPPEGDDDIPF